MLWFLIGAREMQGRGADMTMALALALVGAAVPKAELFPCP